MGEQKAIASLLSIRVPCRCLRRETMASRFFAAWVAGAALFSTGQAYVVAIPTGRFVPSPDLTVKTGDVSTLQGRISWSWKMACTNNLFTGVPQYRPYARLYLHRITPSGEVLVG